MLTKWPLCEVMNIFLKKIFMSEKVKRKVVDWFKVLNDLDRSDMIEYFQSLFSKLRKGKSMSKRRCAYYTLKHFYSTTTIVQLQEKL